MRPDASSLSVNSSNVILQTLHCLGVSQLHLVSNGHSFTKRAPRGILRSSSMTWQVTHAHTEWPRNDLLMLTNKSCSSCRLQPSPFQAFLQPSAHAVAAPTQPAPTQRQTILTGFTAPPAQRGKCDAVLHHVCSMLCCAVACCAVLCCVMPCRTVLCCTYLRLIVVSSAKTRICF